MADFGYYEDQFTMIAEAGLGRINALSNCTHPLVHASPATMDRPVDGEVQRRKTVTEMVRNMEMNYRDAASINYMQPCFEGLAKWIKESTGISTLDAFLSANGFKVSLVFADIVYQCGLGRISESNIEV